ncbi:hypothetical protein [Butyrivibrio sp. AC2005]|uniref:hypothetical protein n=1 Tax=Butyrivibrio sp. AC2005 TaxID=1280672 RepID=UPI0003FC7EFC|nr:hypothetical protein [Butyrivibrio sp. AC2005]
MKGLKQFGAMALAAALTITLAAPISANAEVITEYEYKDGVRSAKSYTNEDTKETLSTADYYGIGKSDVELHFPKTITIATNTYGNRHVFDTTADVAKFANFKSNKKALKVKVVSTNELTDSDKDPVYDYLSKDGKTFYYRNVEDKIVSTTDEAALPKGDSWGSYTVRFYTKKAGTYKLKFDAILKDGTTVKKSIKVIAKADGYPFKSITFAGKSLAQSLDADAAATNELWSKGFGKFTTTAKSGVIRVTMNENFKLKKIEVGTPDIVTKPEGNWTSIGYRDDYTSSLDTVEETDLEQRAWRSDEDRTVVCKWKKVKNGKKIKLAKEDPEKIGIHSSNSGYTWSTKGATTPTYVRITYYDKKNKTTHRTVVTIHKVQK